MNNNDSNKPTPPKELLEVMDRLLRILMVLVVAVIVLPLLVFYRNEIDRFFSNEKKEMRIPAAMPTTEKASAAVKEDFWIAPDISTIPDKALKEQVSYGKELIVHTSKYLGPKGSVRSMSNGMNCQNCHLDAGTKTFGNNYGAVASTYPKFRARSGSQENIYKRVNDCFERSLNGKPLDTLGKEMQAIKAYITFLGSNVKKGEKAKGSGFKDLAYLDRAAEPLKGKEVYIAKCQSCHQANGEGTLNPEGTEYAFPPLWGKNSYNDGAGLYRISNFAKYVKYNMPLGVTYDNTQLTDEEAWDLAAFVNAQPRPHKNASKDWPDISKKPVDHPFGPYADGFSEEQHKFGPFKPIAEALKKPTVGK